MNPIVKNILLFLALTAVLACIDVAQASHRVFGMEASDWKEFMSEEVPGTHVNHSDTDKCIWDYYTYCVIT